MNSIETILYRLRESHLYEMANVSKEDTGLPYDIWIDSAGCTRPMKHGPRIKVAVEGKNRFTMPEISISKNLELKSGRDFAKRQEVINWVIKYYDVLLKHYNHELSDREALNLLSN